MWNLLTPPSKRSRVTSSRRFRKDYSTFVRISWLPEAHYVRREPFCRILGHRSCPKENTVSQPVDPNEVLMTGENSFIRLSLDGGQTLSTRASHWRVLWCSS